MQPVVQQTRSMTDRFAVGDIVFEACKQWWKDTPATNKDLACSQLRKDVRLSQDGNTGKRAGLICSLMSECAAVTLGGTGCNITASNTTAGALSLCSVEGVANGTSVPGIQVTQGELLLQHEAVPLTRACVLLRKSSCPECIPMYTITE